MKPLLTFNALSQGGRDY